MGSVKSGTDVALMNRLDRFEESFLPSFLPVIRKTWAKTIDLNVDRFGQMALQVFSRNPKLVMCETMSIVAAFKTCAEYSLYPDDLRGHVYLVPRYDKDLGMPRCNFMLGYRGWVALFRRSPVADPGKSVSAERVYEGDGIEIVKGLEEKLVHVPNLEEQAKKDRKLKLVYAILRYKGGESDFDYVMGWQIQEIKDHLSDGAESQFSPWRSKSDLVRSWMEKKTPLRQVLKLSPALDDTLAGAVSLDEKVDAGVDQVLAANMDKQLIAVAQKLLEAGKDTVAVPAGIKGSEAAGTALDTFIAQKKAEADKTSEKKPEPEQADLEKKTEPTTDEPEKKAEPTTDEPEKKAEPTTDEPDPKESLKGEKDRLRKWLIEHTKEMCQVYPQGTKYGEKVGELREQVAKVRAHIEAEEDKAGPFQEPAATEPTPATETPEPKGGDDIESETGKGGFVGNGPSDPDPEPPTIDEALKDDADEPNPAEAWEKFMGNPA